MGARGAALANSWPLPITGVDRLQPDRRYGRARTAVEVDDEVAKPRWFRWRIRPPGRYAV